MDRLNLFNQSVDIILVEENLSDKSKFLSIEEFNTLVEINPKYISIISEEYFDLIKFLKLCEINNDNLMETLNLALETQYGADGLYVLTELISCNEIDTEKEQVNKFTIHCNSELSFEVDNVDYLNIEDVTYIVNQNHDEEDEED